jgi:hypothetical protein
VRSHRGARPVRAGRPLRAGAWLAASVSATAFLAGCGGPDLGALGGKSADQILSSTIAAAETQAGVHYQLRATTGPQNQVITGDAGSTEGEQEVATGADLVDVQLIGGTAFVRGNAGGLQHTIGLAASVAAAYAGKWISVSPSDTLFQPITQAVTLKGIFGQLRPSGMLSTGSPTTIDGQRAVGVRGGLPGQVARGVSGTAVLYVSVQGPNLPVGFSGEARSASQHVTDIGAFDRWGEHLALTPPSGAVPFSGLPKA